MRPAARTIIGFYSGRRCVIAQRQTKPLFAAYRNYAEASDAVTKLRNIGVPMSRISIIMSENARELVPKVRSAAPEVAVAGGGIGALIGGLAAVASLALPGVGVLAAGPIAAALGGGTLGAASGGLVGALIGFGIPEPQAKQYAEAVLNDGMIVAVHPTSATMADNVSTLFKATRGVRMEHVERTIPAKITKPIRDVFDSKTS